MLKVNPFLRINFLNELPYLSLVNINKDYKVSDFIVFILVTIKNNKYSYSKLLEYINKNTQYCLSEEELNKLIKINAISENEYNDFNSNDIWYKYNWEEAYYYLLSTKDYPFLDYNSGKTFIEDQRKMEEYIGNGKMPPQKRNIVTTEEYKLLDNIDYNLSINDIYSGKQIDISEEEKISLLFNTGFGFQGKNYLGYGWFPKKMVPSGGSRHPSEGYLFDIKGTFNKGGVFYYDGEVNTLKLVNKYKNIKNEINNFSYGYLDELDFEPNYGIAITSNLLRSMWRYRDSRSYRVIFNDVGHIISVITTFLHSLGISFTEFSFIDEPKVIKSINSSIIEDEILEKPIYFLLFK